MQAIPMPCSALRSVSCCNTYDATSDQHVYNMASLLPIDTILIGLRPSLSSFNSFRVPQSHCGSLPP